MSIIAGSRLYKLGTSRSQVLYRIGVSKFARASAMESCDFYESFLNIFYVGRLCATVFNPSHPNPERWEKIKSNFYFYTSLWCLKHFMKAFKAFIKPIEAQQRSAKLKFNLIFISIQLSEMHALPFQKKLPSKSPAQLGLIF